MKRDVLTLTVPEAPRLLRMPAGYDDEAMGIEVRDAMRAALKGDFRKLDELELRVLNVLVRIGELFVKHPDGTPHWWFDPHDARVARLDREGLAPFVVTYHRGHGPQARAGLEWWLAEKCRRCAGRLRHAECRICGGTWFVSDASDDVLYTDSDGVLIQEEA